MYLDKNINVDFRQIIIYLLYYTAVLLIGSVMRNAVVIIPLILYIYYLVKNNISNLVLFIIFWMYVERFYLGQGFVSNSYLTVFMYPNYYIFVTFVIYYKIKYINNMFEKRLMLWGILYVIYISIRDYLINNKLGIGNIAAPYIIYL